MAAKLWQEVFEEEKTFIGKWREIREKDKPDNSAPPDGKAPEDLVGLAFSGGGIRSATFGLGVLEALKENDLLKKIDYLSTVSGGGYIGSWLSANCKRTEVRRREQGNNNEPLDPQWIASDADWTQSITHLRRFSNYLSPNPSMFSADSLSNLNVWLSNTFLILILLLFTIACLLLLPRILFFDFYEDWFDWHDRFSLIFFATSVTFIALNLKNMNPAWAESLNWLPNQKFTLFWIKIAAVFLLLASYSFAGLLVKHAEVEIRSDSIQSFSDTLISFIFNFIYLKILFGASLFSFGLFSFFSINHKDIALVKKALLVFFTSLITTLVLILLLTAILMIINQWASQYYHPDKGRCMAYVWTPTLVIASISLAVNVFIGLQGRAMDEYVREWWSRFLVFLFIIGTPWFIIVIVAFYGPLWSFWLYYEGPWISVMLGWLLITAVGLLATRASDTDRAKSKVEKFYNKAVGKAALCISTASLLVAVSTMLHLIIAINPADPAPGIPVSREMLLIYDNKYPTEDFGFILDKRIWDLIDKKAIGWDVHFTLSTYKPAKPDFVNTAHWKLLNNSYKVSVLWIATIILMCLLILGRRIDINASSLNVLYRNRLARCYLGAARLPDKRNPHPFTSFDPEDDLSLADLISSEGKPSGPLHLVNCALNLGGSSDLLLHTRHSNSFTLSPLYCGSAYKQKNTNNTEISEIGFVATEIYGGIKKVTLGQAMAVSGAAASPNMGYHTSTLVSFFMTLLNARLGYWFPHPLYSDCSSPSPSNSLKYLIDELFGAANEKREFLNISDGGHFENLAAYELIRRQCKVIIISDGECDPKLQFEGLANLIRICKVDFNAEIKIDVSDIKPESVDGWSKNRCAVGTIKYQGEAKPSGWLIYLKAAMTGHEDIAIMQYKDKHPDFPHETTGDQSYAEDQFESYRALGKDIAVELFGKFDGEEVNQTERLVSLVSGWKMAEIAEKLYRIVSP